MSRSENGSEKRIIEGINCKLEIRKTSPAKKCNV